MARKGEIGRQHVMDTIIAAFGDKYVCTQDKKIYVMANDGGELIQFAISLTMPKTPVGNVPSSGFDWSMPAAVDSSEPAPAAEPQMSAEDEAKVQELMKMLNII